MMHGYLAFDAAGKLLVPFRTWRNTMTGAAAEELTSTFGFNIPQRWSAAHLYQAMLNREPHLPQLDFFTTLAGYVHWQLTGRKVLGEGDASGMFPIDSTTGGYDAAMLAKFNALADKQGCPVDLVKLLPTVLPAGEDAGMLTVEGAKRLDPTGTLQPGIPFCPPEGDAGTGMVATNSVAPRTGNVSAGTSIFAMVVLEKPLSKVYPEIDMVTTPDGAAVAMVHCNNCTSDLNAWVDLLAKSAALCGANIDKGALFTLLFNESLHGAPDCGGITPVNYISGESVTHLDAGVPLLLRRPDSAFTLANFMRANIYSAFATLAMGLEILRKENVAVNTLLGHGGIFKTPGVAQRYLAAAMGADAAADYTEVTLDRPFYGVYSGYAALPLAGETLRYLTNDTIAACRVTNFETGGEGPVYDLEKARGSDPYELFLSGSVSLLTVESPNARTDRELVIFRDSFASSLAPLLLEGYSRVTLVDIRYLSPTQLGRYLTFTDQDVLFLYSTGVLNNSSTLK